MARKEERHVSRPPNLCAGRWAKRAFVGAAKYDKRYARSLAGELKLFVGREIGAIAKPDVIQFAPGLPKTRSGKIMRRILRKVAEGDTSSLGDISTLADPSVVDDLIKGATR